MGDGLVGDEALRESLSEESAQTLALMLEELRSAGLGWNHPFVQCRMKAALHSLRYDIPMPNNVCAAEMPTRDDVVWLQDPSAVINFAPPNTDYADEVYVPPMKKGFAIEQPPSIERAVFGPRNRPILIDDDANVEVNDDDDMASRIQDVKNRIELRKMLAEYTAGALKPPIYLKDDIINSDDVYYQDEPISEDDRDKYLVMTEKRQKAQNRPQSDVLESPLSSLFHENKVPAGINADGALDRSSNDASVNRFRPLKMSKIPNEAGVYTEGGLVVPDTSDTNGCEYSLLYGHAHRKRDLLSDFYFTDDRETEARNLLADMLGFTRHERLDVKKPGPPASPPITDLKSNDVPSSPVKLANSVDSTVEPNEHNERVQKIKKLVHFDDDDHAPHSVDTEYAHVYLKTS